MTDTNQGAPTGAPARCTRHSFTPKQEGTIVIALLRRAADSTDTADKYDRLHDQYLESGNDSEAARCARLADLWRELATDARDAAQEFNS